MPQHYSNPEMDIEIDRLVSGVIVGADFKGFVQHFYGPDIINRDIPPVRQIARIRGVARYLDHGKAPDFLGGSVNDIGLHDAGSALDIR